jgi:hypothetical protein
MTSPPWSGWLRRTSGATIAIPDRGIVIGRRPDCDVVLGSPRASSVHAIITPTLDGLELVALGRNPTTVDGAPASGRVLLRHGAKLVLPGGEFTVERGRDARWSERPWAIRHPDGHRYALRRLPFTLGGDRADHLLVPGWPAGAVSFHAAEGAVAAEFHVPAMLNDAAMASGAVEVVEDRDEIRCGGAAVVVESSAPRDRTPTVVAGSTGLQAVRFEFLPTGGRVTLHPHGAVEPLSIELPELRARLIASLLTPPAGYAPGDLIPDELLIPAIWSGSAERTRVDLNVLIYRTRKDLLKAGINPGKVLIRARNGGSTRIRLAADARVSVV